MTQQEIDQINILRAIGRPRYYGQGLVEKSLPDQMMEALRGPAPPSISPFLSGLHFILGRPLAWCGDWFAERDFERFMARVRGAGESCRVCRHSIYSEAGYWYICSRVWCDCQYHRPRPQ